MKVDRAFKKLADSLPLMMAYVDNQGRYQHVNQAYRNFIGLELNQVKTAIAQVINLISSIFDCFKHLACPFH